MTVKPPKPFNMDNRRRQIESKRLELENDQDYNYTPLLLLATSAGFSEIIEKILHFYPGAVHHVSEDGHNVLHMAVKHRQKKVFAVIDRKNASESLALRITKSGDTKLQGWIVIAKQHSKEQPTTYGMEGVAFQLQDELRWFDSGCCKPSEDCGFTYQNPTNFTKTANATYTNPDCDAWNNDPNVLCFNCQSCKAGLLQNLKTDWKKVAVVNIIVLISLIIVYSIGCCAFRNNRRNNSWKRYCIHNDSVLIACR